MKSLLLLLYPHDNVYQHKRSPEYFAEITSVTDTVISFRYTKPIPKDEVISISKHLFYQYFIEYRN